MFYPKLKVFGILGSKGLFGIWVLVLLRVLKVCFLSFVSLRAVPVGLLQTLLSVHNTFIACDECIMV